MLFHLIPIIRSDDTLEDQLGLENIVEKIRETLAETTDELTELQFVTQNLCGFTEVECLVIVCQTRWWQV